MRRKVDGLAAQTQGQLSISNMKLMKWSREKWTFCCKNSRATSEQVVAKHTAVRDLQSEHCSILHIVQILIRLHNMSQPTSSPNMSGHTIWPQLRVEDASESTIILSKNPNIGGTIMRANKEQGRSCNTFTPQSHISRAKIVPGNGSVSLIFSSFFARKYIKFDMQTSLAN